MPKLSAQSDVPMVSNLMFAGPFLATLGSLPLQDSSRKVKSRASHFLVPNSPARHWNTQKLGIILTSVFFVLVDSMREAGGDAERHDLLRDFGRTGTMSSEFCSTLALGQLECQYGPVMSLLDVSSEAEISESWQLDAARLAEFHDAAFLPVACESAVVSYPTVEASQSACACG